MCPFNILVIVIILNSNLSTIYEDELSNNAGSSAIHTSISLDDDLGPTGRRVVDIGYILNQISNIKHTGFGCTFSDLKFVQEIRHGYYNTFTPTYIYIHL